jgi:benzoyl-CoA reductase/2-hydroxyglutaryl-CoA dehydratase subunit BcrC/BadD/HgdB
MPAAALEHAYQDRWAAARKAKAEGRPVIGVIGEAPRELAIACGALMISAAADRTAPTPAADRYIDDIVSADAHALLQAALDGAFESLDLLVLTRAHDKLFYYLKECLRIGDGGRFPPLHMFDLMQSRRPAVETYNRLQFDALIRRIERAAGRTIADDALDEALKQTDAIHASLRKLMDHRRAARLSGVDALSAIGAGRFMEANDYARELAAFVDALDGAESIKGPRLLVASAEPLDNLALHARLEAAGGLVVAEDDPFGSRVLGDDVEAEGPAREVLLRRAWLGAVGAEVFPPEARLAWFEREAAAPDIDAIVFNIPTTDQIFGWDYPRLKAAADRAGKPSLLIREPTDDVAAFLAPLGRAA